MNIIDKHVAGVCVIRPVGSIDAVSAPEVLERFSELISEGNAEIVADFTEVDYTSSAGLRVLLSSVKETRAKGGDVRLAGVRPDVLKVLELSGFADILQIYDDLDAAISSFSSSDSVRA